MDSIYTVVITAITVLGGSTAFRYYERRAMHRERDEDFIRHDCRDRISKLEALLVESKEEKDKMRELILRLTSEVAELRMKVEFLTDENEKLNKEKKKLNG
jgi:peptidoglycan hydrolase CwlO-like protein